ncbi:flagellar biosynthesis protein FlhA [Tabrizicola sp.]|uniref:flagellar biosynthesis protein FlhA n=1 Tax=Tabrizicola sp. TaxID=2005166 RepID=UPI0035B450A6
MTQASRQKPAGALDGLLDVVVRLTGNRDVTFAVGVSIILAVLFVPLPPVLLDIGLALSITLSILVLMVALWVNKPLEFSSFPTLLLVVTMLRLALNVASSRLILAEGQNGTDAAGHVIEGIAHFVVGGDFVIGAVIFSILIVINFMVITKGSTRIAEVSARFSLDAMPGKQMAIDADLGAGAIDEDEARRRRKEVEGESNFFGAMDGAAKFVRGDAVAGIIITLVNIVGGVLIGAIRHGMPIAEAVQNYTVLTIGDGLVTQIPALVVSLAAGMIVTKGSNEGTASEAVSLQLGASPKALYVAGVLVAGLGLLPGFPHMMFLALGTGLALVGMTVGRAAERRRVAAEEAARRGPVESPEDQTDPLRIDAIRMDLGTGLMVLVNDLDAALPGKVRSLRNLFMSDYGFVLPPVRIRDDAGLKPNAYRISIHGLDVATGELRPGGRLLIDPMNEAEGIPGEQVREPTFGLKALWIDASRAAEAEAAGFTVVDPESVAITHMTEVIKEHLPDLLTFGATQDLIKRLDRDYQKLVSDIPAAAPAILLQQVLQRLLAERLSIRNLPMIVEAIVEAAAVSKNPVVICEHVRRKLAAQICHGLEDADGFVPVMVLGPKWEAEFAATVRTQGEESVCTMSPAKVQEFILAARVEIQKFAAQDQWPALLVTPDLRPIVRSILERVSGQTQIVSHSEIHRKARLKTVGSIGA